MLCSALFDRVRAARGKKPGFSQKLAVLLLLSPMVVFATPASTDTAEKSAVDSTGNADEKYAVRDFPKWPQKRYTPREIVPPPPTGPYMSTALTNHMIEAPSFVTRARDMHLDSSDYSIENFNPDIPWPTSLRPTKRWKPENGYHFVAPQQNHQHLRQQNAMKSQPFTAKSPSGSFGYRPQSAPVMNWSGMPFGNDNRNAQNNRAYTYGGNNRGSYASGRYHPNQRPGQAPGQVPRQAPQQSYPQ